MQLTKQSEYALQGLAFLAAADPERAIPLAEIAEAQHLPASFLAKIFQKLVRHGILAAARGRGSGYQLARDPESLKVRDILEAVEGPRVLERCQFWQGHCSDTNPCPLHAWFKHLKPAFDAQLNAVTLAEYMRHAEQVRREDMSGHTRAPWVRMALVGALLAAVIPHVLSAQVQSAPAPEAGKRVFDTMCAACHTIGGGRLVGPDLQGVSDRRPEQWIVRFVQHSQQLVAAGDPDAVAIFEEYNRIPMPDQPLSADQIRDVLAHIRGAASGAAAPPADAPRATEAEVLLGQALFQGTTRLTNGGPTCNSCHEVTNDAVIGGGILARELTTVFSRLGGPGVRSILGSPPFPVMQRAYANKPLTEGEIVALVGFLQQADEQQAFHQPRDYGPKLFASGILGTAILLGLSALVWRGRLKGSVNQAIYDRQIKSG